MNKARAIAQTLSPAVLMSFAALLSILCVLVYLQPRSLSYVGARLLLNYSMPLVLAAAAQMFVIVLGDIDLGIGSFISLSNAVAALYLPTNVAFASLLFVAGVLAYAGMGALIEIRRLPSIVVTLGASFVWIGFAIIVMPRPGGSAPGWLIGLVRGTPPLVPPPVYLALLVFLACWSMLFASSYGSVVRAFGNNPAALSKAGWRLVGLKAGAYGAAGVFGVLAGIVLTGLNTTGDATSGGQYTLLAIAAVIIGGGRFSGGYVSPAGTVVGALILALTAALLSFMNISTDWQLSVQGTLLLIVLGVRAFIGAERRQ